ncbi:Sensors of blue-light using FAD [Thalassovita gelatinovora]|uniref:Sensors of blue-light using FAD n=1 Tax=Thalassovita gelatinovora TaxID=53501 RepID=A0A0P1F3R1_THAGE|nr:BLUF domain-containing protein [Thalassovita gelatinovora]QIZ81763.1 BLUF domain-containing protein [Thalassovita gelatinovora]CUH62348.1 Sensors of blue-light using FAD [Thalassovita gelatinovora]SER16246.1 Sensors of blue-light using FAD [Thalassovita gelatinovora]
MTIRLLYTSRAPHPMGGQTDLDILTQSLENNSKLHITGYLVRVPKAFFQVLEGPEDKVLDLFEKIKTDHRHSDVTILSCEPIETTLFDQWAMGYRMLSEERAALFDKEPPMSETETVAIVHAMHKIATADLRTYKIR